MSDAFNQLEREVDQETGDDRQRADAVANIERQLAEERQGRREDRFVFVVVFLVIGDAWIFRYMGGWAGPFCITIFELLGLLVFARRYGIEEVGVWLNRALNSYGRKDS